MADTDEENEYLQEAQAEVQDFVDEFESNHVAEIMDDLKQAVSCETLMDFEANIEEAISSTKRLLDKLRILKRLV